MNIRNMTIMLVPAMLLLASCTGTSGTSNHSNEASQREIQNTNEALDLLNQQIAHSIQSYKIQDPSPKILEDPKVVMFPDRMRVTIRPYRMITPRQMSGALCGIEINGQSIDTLGVGELEVYTCDKLIEIGPLPSAGTSRRIGLIYDASSPNAEVRTALVLIGDGENWRLDPESPGRFDGEPAAKSIKALAKALK